ALSVGDMVRLGRLMAQSHVSMRDDFQATVPAIDRLVDIVGAVIGEGAGVRMTGGGFGGCVVALVPEPRVAAVQAAVELGYRSPDGRAATVYVCRAQEGAGAL
ncbi:MAG: galactokinase, partial [Rhodoferax sp.]|nr:galactokinase [Rhodoferax sp.]